MSMNLRLCPLDHYVAGSAWGYSHTLLELGPVDAPTYDRLRAIARQLPDGHDVATFVGGRIASGKNKGELTYGKVSADAYGDRMTWLTAGELAPLISDYRRDRPGVVAYVKAIAADTLVILDWH